MKPRSSTTSSAKPFITISLLFFSLLLFLTSIANTSNAAATPNPTQGGRPFSPRSSNDNNDGDSNIVTVIFGETKRGLVAGPTRLDIDMTQRSDGRWQGQEPLGDGLYTVKTAYIQSGPGMANIVCFLVWYRAYDAELGYRPDDLAYQPITVEQPLTGTIERVSYVLCQPKFGGLG